jgi:isoamylase
VPGEVLALRRRQAKNLIALLLLSNGTPMLRAGDELLHTQRGNNNPYDQDELTWLDWSRADPGFWRFVQQMIAFRKAHPSLARSRFWRDDVRWYGPRGPADMSSRTLAFLLRGGSAGDDDLYVMINGGPLTLPFVIQEPDALWCLAVDTARASPGDVDVGASEAVMPSHVVEGRSVVVLLRRWSPR